MFEDDPDDLLVFDEADDPHRPFTFRADEGIDLINLLSKGV